MERRRNFIVWAMQRTGGTSLTALLANMQTAETVHEPFNGPKARGAYAQDRERVSRNAPFEDLRGKNIKHCYEYSADEFNDALLGMGAGLGYASLLLLRRDDLARAESLALAKLTNAYGVAAASVAYPRIRSGEIALPPIDITQEMRHLRRCVTKTAALAGVFRDRGLPVICYEDVFSGGDPGERVRALCAVMEAQGLTLDPAAALDNPRAMAIFDRKQDSASIASFVPNIEEFRDAVRRYLATAAPHLPA